MDRPTTPDVEHFMDLAPLIAQEWLRLKLIEEYATNLVTLLSAGTTMDKLKDTVEELREALEANR